MCGRFTLRATPAELAEFFELSRAPQIEPRANIAPTQQVLGIVLHDGEVRQAQEFRWGLIPSWAKDAREAARRINARSETVADKPSFRSAFRSRRCLIPADGFYEWKSIPGQKKKQPCWIGVRDQPLVAFAGLWEQWQPPEGDPLTTCTILTTAANSAVASLHDRMPVILPPETFDRWLHPHTPRDELLSLLLPYPAEEMVLSASLAEELLQQRPPSRQGTLF